MPICCINGDNVTLMLYLCKMLRRGETEGAVNGNTLYCLFGKDSCKNLFVNLKLFFKKVKKKNSTPPLFSTSAPSHCSRGNKTESLSHTPNLKFKREEMYQKLTWTT